MKLNYWYIMRPQMSRPLIVNRVGSFIWSILPPDHSHALLLLGSAFLFISDRLRWWPNPTFEWALAVRFFTIPIYLAGAAGYYLCFLRCEKPARRLFETVLLPAFLGLLAIPIVGFVWFRNDVEPLGSVLTSVVNAHSWDPREFLQVASGLGTGIQVGSIGFVCVAIFFGLLLSGRTTLPIGLAELSTSSSTGSASEEEHRRTMLFVWLMIAIVFLASFPRNLLDGIFVFISPNGVPSARHWFVWLNRLLDTVSLLIFILLAIGKDGRKAIPAMFRIPPAKYLALAALIPAVVANAWPLAAYCVTRVHWSAHGWGTNAPPPIGDFFDWPVVSSLWYFAPALVEEIAWRGYLQPRFIRRYGLIRGIFFVGVVWGAFHFSGDFNWHMTFGDVLGRLATRIIGTVVLSFVFAWLTIWSESILPAAVAHAVYNIFFIYYSPQYKDPWWLSAILWAVVGYVLLRYFPPPTAADVDDQPDISPTPEPEPSGV